MGPRLKSWLLNKQRILYVAPPLNCLLTVFTLDVASADGLKYFSVQYFSMTLVLPVFAFLLHSSHFIHIMYVCIFSLHYHLVTSINLYVIIFFRQQESRGDKVKDNICHLSYEEKMVKTTVKAHFVRALCLGCVNLFSGLTLWPLSSTTWWDLAAGCVWVEVCIFTQRPQSPLNTTPPWLSPPSSSYMCLPVYVCTHVCRLTCVWLLLILCHTN